MAAFPSPSPTGSSKPHALLFPLPALGHINPIMQLAYRLASSDIQTTLLLPPRLLSLIPHASQNQLLKQQEEEEPRFIETKHPGIRIALISDGIPARQSERITGRKYWESVVRMVCEVETFVLTDLSSGGHPVSRIIFDTVLPGVQELADRLSIPGAAFWSSAAIAYSVNFHIPLLISKGYIPFKGKMESSSSNKDEGERKITCIPGVPPVLRMRDLPDTILVEDVSSSSLQSLSRLFARVQEQDWILVHSIYELESTIIDALRAAGVSIYPIGPLLPLSFDAAAPSKAPRMDLLHPDDNCLQWLDNRSTASSVLYISFGSSGLVSAEEIRELALGLEASQQPFLWVIRPDSAAHDSLPAEFLSTTRERGLIVGWAPQLRVLSHACVGGFLSHCGWNSTMESIEAGVPMLGWPREHDQKLNGRFVSEVWKMGFMIEEEEGGRLRREGIEVGVRRLMQEEEGREARRRAREMREVARGAASMEGGEGSSARNLGMFVAAMRTSTAAATDHH